MNNYNNDNNDNFNIDEIKMNSISNLPTSSINYINNLAINPIILIILVIIIIIYFLLFKSLNNNSQNTMQPQSGNNFLEAILWGLFIILILVNGASYFLNTNIFATIKNFFTNEPELNISLDNSYITNDGSVNPKASESEQVFENPISKEVYHVSDNKYTYNEAKAVCKAFDGELATYQQIEDAYDKGASWCSYGWSADQLALFPTNIETWEKIKKDSSNPHACGRPGINGGYIANPNTRFGVNCYGNKPFITSQEKYLMNTSSYLTKTTKDKNFDNLVNHYKNKLKDIIISPFNKNNWNESIL